MEPQPLPRWASGNVAFCGTHATKGYGLSVAIAVGRNTEVGKLAERSFMERPVSRVAIHLKQVGLYMICVAILWFAVVIGLFSKDDSYIQLEIYITLMLAMTPMYLPFVLFWGMQRTKDAMQKNQCYARNLVATSTVGLTTVIVSDMTRTITQRWMRVTEIFVDMELVNADNANPKELGPRFLELIQASVLCNDAVVNSGNIGVPKEKKSMYGSFPDIALLRYGLFILPDIKRLRKDHEKVANKVYTSTDRVQVTVHRTYGTNGQLRLLLLMKGHCDTVLRRCSTYSVRDEEVPLDDLLQDTIIKLAEGLMAGGRHVRAFAYKELTNRLEMRRVSHMHSGGGGSEFRDYLAVDTFSLRFLGLIATYTPPRATIPKAVARCRSAGIKLIVVTGRNPNMARAMASEVGLLSPHLDEIQMGRRLSDYRSFSPTEIVDMSEYAEMADHHQRWYIGQMLLNQRDLVCANATPEQFHWIVDVCQGLGAVVSVIGGTLHHAAALKRGHVGVARLGCAPICEYSSDLVLLDSSLATLTRAIGQSRLLFENLKKALVYCLATNTIWLASYLAFYVLRLPMLFDIIDIIIVSVFVNLLPSLALLYEFPEEKLMDQKPKIYDDCLLNRRLLFVSHILLGCIEAAAVFTTYIMFMVEKGFVPSDLVNLNSDWYDQSHNDLTDSMGQEWSWAERKQLNCQVSSVCMMAITVMQCTSLVLNQTARTNLLEHGFDNWRVKLAAVYLIVSCFLISYLDSICCLYLPGAKQLDLGAFLLVICPFVPLMVFLESARKYFLRMFRDSWIERATMY